MSILGDLVNALSLGVVYALIAVSVGLVFGVLRQVNLAQGEVIAFGAYTLWITRSLPAVARVVVCVAACIAMSVAIQVLVFRPLRGASALTTLIVTFGLSYALEAVWLIVFGSNGNAAASFASLNNAAVSSIDLRWITFVEIGVGAVLFAGLVAVLYRSSLGMTMRAAAEDPRTARLVGVRINRVVMWAFVFSGVTAAVVAILTKVQSPLVTPGFGLSIIIVALVGVVVGGIDSLGRATAGGLVIGFVSSLVAAVLPEQQMVFLPSLTFLFVIVVLLIRPAGLFTPRGSRVDRV